MAGGFVYFMSNRRNGILYVGVTSNLPARAYHHRQGLVDGFTKQYGLKLLVYYEAFDDIREAIAREKAIKHWPYSRNESGVERFVRHSVLATSCAVRAASCAGLSRASTPFSPCGEGVDGRDKPGHDE
jgi:putative endonuclease